MSIIESLKSLFFKSKEKEIVVKQKRPIPEGFVSVEKAYPYLNIYINEKGQLFDPKKGILEIEDRYCRIFGVYHYIPRMMLEVFKDIDIKNIHRIVFKDGNRDNWNLDNLDVIDFSDIGYFIINNYTHEVQSDIKGSLKRDEYRVDKESLLDHNWTNQYREWMKEYSLPTDYYIAKLIVDVQHKTLEFVEHKRGVPLGHPEKGKIVYKVICDRAIDDFWIIPPVQSSRLRDLVRFNTSYKLKTI